MTQEALAKLTGYTSRTSIAKIEAGSVDLAQSKIKQFADALHTTPSCLMGFEENQYELDTNLLLNIDLDTLEYIKKLIKLSDTSKNVVYNMIDILQEKER